MHFEVDRVGLGSVVPGVAFVEGGRWSMTSWRRMDRAAGRAVAKGVMTKDCSTGGQTTQDGSLRSR